MDIILARAGVHGTALQLQVCVGAVRSEVQKTQRQLDAALSALQRLLRVAKLASDTGERSSLAQLAPDLAVHLDRIQNSERVIDTHIQELRAVIHTSSLPETQERRELRAPDRLEVVGLQAPAQAARRFRAQERVAVNSFIAPAPAQTTPRRTVARRVRSPQATSFLRPFSSGSEGESEEEDRAPKRQRVKVEQPLIPVRRVAQAKTPLEKLKASLADQPEESNEVFETALRAAVKIEELEEVTGDEESIPQCMQAAQKAIRYLLTEHESFADGGVHHFEDTRQVLQTLVRAIVQTKGQLEAAQLRELLSLVTELQHSSIAPARRTSWCRTNLRKFIMKQYAKPAEETAADQQELVTILAEVRKWKSRADFTLARFDAIMATVGVLFEGEYEDWKPQEDARVTMLVQLLNFQAGSFSFSAVQSHRVEEFTQWQKKMSAASFVPTLNLASQPPNKPSALPIDPQRRYFWPANADGGLKYVDDAKERDDFGWCATTLCQFMEFITSTSQPPLSLEQIRRLIKAAEGLKDLSRDKMTLHDTQNLEKILYMLRIVMHKQPEYEEICTSAVDTLLSFFPSDPPAFTYPSKIAAVQPLYFTHSQ